MLTILLEGILRLKNEEFSDTIRSIIRSAGPTGTVEGLGYIKADMPFVPNQTEKECGKYICLDCMRPIERQDMVLVIQEGSKQTIRNYYHKTCPKS